VYEHYSRYQNNAIERLIGLGKHNNINRSTTAIIIVWWSLLLCSTIVRLAVVVRGNEYNGVGHIYINYNRFICFLINIFSVQIGEEKKYIALYKYNKIIKTIQILQVKKNYIYIYITTAHTHWKYIYICVCEKKSSLKHLRSVPVNAWTGFSDWKGRVHPTPARFWNLQEKQKRNFSRNVYTVMITSVYVLYIYID